MDSARTMMRLVVLAVMVAGGGYMWSESKEESRRVKRVMQEGVAAQGIITHMGGPTGSHRGGGRTVTVCFYADGRPGVPGTKDPFAQLGAPLVSPLTGRRIMPPRPVISSVIPGSPEMVFEGGRVIMRPTGGGKTRVTRSFYEGLSVGEIVSVRYLRSDPKQFVIPGDKGQGGASTRWYLAMWLGVVALLLLRLVYRYTKPRGTGG